MSQFADRLALVFFATGCLALLGAVFVFAFLRASMWSHRKKDNWLYPVDIFWWLPARANRHFSDAGMVRYRRGMRTFVGLLGLSLAMMLATLLAE